MNRSVKSALMAGAAAILLSGTTTQALAQQGPGQGRGNFDPAQMRQQMIERYRERLEITSDDEWKLIQARIEKVSEARRQVGFGGGMAMMGGMGGGRGNRPGANATAPQGGTPPPAAAGDQGGRRGNRGGFGADPSPEAEALQKAIDGKASAEELKTKLAAFREARKAKEAALEKAQQELRAVLTVRQEAAAVLFGLLN